MGEIELLLHASFALAIGGRQWSRHGLATVPKEKKPDTNWTGHWAGPRAGLWTGYWVGSRAGLWTGLGGFKGRSVYRTLGGSKGRTLDRKLGGSRTGLWTGYWWIQGPVCGQDTGWI